MLIFDASHTPCTKSGEKISYQGRKKRKTTNSLYLTDKHGIPLAMMEPEAGNHHEAHETNAHFNEVASVLKDSEINRDGLFMNADSGFDCHHLRTLCFDMVFWQTLPETKETKQ